MSFQNHGKVTSVYSSCPSCFTPHFHLTFSNHREISFKKWYVFFREILRSHVVVRATYRTIRPGNSRFHAEISSPFFFLPGKASSVETINLAHPNGSSTANAIVRRRSAFRSPGGFRDDEPLKSVWLSTLSPPSSFIRITLFFSIALVSDCEFILHS